MNKGKTYYKGFEVVEQEDPGTIYVTGSNERIVEFLDKRRMPTTRERARLAVDENGQFYIYLPVGHWVAVNFDGGCAFLA